MPDSKTPYTAPYLPHRDAIRAKGFTVTPFRMGIQIGDTLPCPYTNRHSADSFAAGVRHHRAKKQEEARTLRAATLKAGPL